MYVTLCAQSHSHTVSTRWGRHWVAVCLYRMKAVTESLCRSHNDGGRMCPRDCVRLHDDTVTESDTVKHRVGRHNDGLCLCHLSSLCNCACFTKTQSQSHCDTHCIRVQSHTVSKSPWLGVVCVCDCVRSDNDTVVDSVARCANAHTVSHTMTPRVV